MVRVDGIVTMLKWIIHSQSRGSRETWRFVQGDGMKEMERRASPVKRISNAIQHIIIDLQLEIVRDRYTALPETK